MRTVKPFFHRTNPRSRTGKVGVTLLVRRIPRPSRTMLVRRFFVTRISFAGHTHVAQFSVNTLGLDAAWQAAVAQRARWERRLTALQAEVLAAHQAIKRRYPHAPWVWKREMAAITREMAGRGWF